jgi:hypothetical protein
LPPSTASDGPISVAPARGQPGHECAPFILRGSTIASMPVLCDTTLTPSDFNVVSQKDGR